MENGALVAPPGPIHPWEWATTPFGDLGLIPLTLVTPGTPCWPLQSLSAVKRMNREPHCCRPCPDTGSKVPSLTTMRCVTTSRAKHPYYRPMKYFWRARRVLVSFPNSWIPTCSVRRSVALRFLRAAVNILSNQLVCR